MSHEICSISTLSRIEGNSQSPGRSIFESLMERLGQSPDVYPSFMTMREAELFRSRHALSEHLEAGHFAEVDTLMKYIASHKDAEQINYQFVAFAKAALLRRTGGSPQEVLKAMQDVVAISIKELNPKKIPRYYLTKAELSMLNYLAIAYKEVGDPDTAIEILYGMKEYIERKVVYDTWISSTYTAMLHTLTNTLGQQGHHEEVIKLCDLGIQRCIEYGTFTSFATLLFNKGYALIELGRKKEGKKYIQEAYYMDRARNDTVCLEITENYAKEIGIRL